MWRRQIYPISKFFFRSRDRHVDHYEDREDHGGGRHGQDQSEKDVFLKF